MPDADAYSKRLLRWINDHRGTAAIAAVLVVAVWGIGSRLETRYMLRRDADRESMPTVAVVKTIAAPRSEELVLPGNVQAYVSAPIYARTNGYLKSWQADIGTKVKAGQQLAEIETPEVDQQLVQAEADLRTAEANENLARSTAERWAALLKTDSVTKQEADEKNGDYASKRALAESARANLKRLQDLRGFQRIVAPFDGTITARNVDIGQLISNAGGVELFHISDLRKLRVYVQVPQPYAPTTHLGLGAELYFAERPNQKYTAKIVRTAEALDPTARTLLVELEVDNTKGDLFPGSYTEVHFQMPASNGRHSRARECPDISRAGLVIATLGADNRVDLKPVVLGRDFGTEIEVVSGLDPEASVIVNPPDSLEQGIKVRVVQPTPAPPSPSGTSSR